MHALKSFSLAAGVQEGGVCVCVQHSCLNWAAPKDGAMKISVWFSGNPTTLDVSPCKSSQLTEQSSILRMRRDYRRLHEQPGA